MFGTAIKREHSNVEVFHTALSYTCNMLDNTPTHSERDSSEKSKTAWIWGPKALQGIKKVHAEKKKQLKSARISCRKFG